VEQLIGLVVAVILWTLAAILWLLGSAFSRQLTDEFKAWTPRLTDWLTQYAVRKLPKNQRERFAEEWHSHINDTPGEIGKIYFALGLLLAPSAMPKPITTLEPLDRREDTSFGITGPTGVASFAGAGSFGMPTGPTGAASFAGAGSIGVPTGPTGKPPHLQGVGSFRGPAGPTGAASG
jgi:hypothetical protein